MAGASWTLGHPALFSSPWSELRRCERHIAETGRLRVWTDQARWMWPLFHEVLLAYVLRLGGDRLIAVTAFEWLAAVGAVSALARRVSSRP